MNDAVERRERDDRGLFVLKFAAFGALFALLATTVGDVAAGVVLFAAAGAALEWLIRKIVKPLVRLASMLDGLPEWMARVDSWRVEQRMARVEEQLEQAAESAVTAATQADVAAGRATESVNVVRAIARAVGAQVRGDPDDE